MSKPTAFLFFGISILFLLAGLVTLFQPPLTVNVFLLGFVFDLMWLFGIGFALLFSTITTLKYPLHFASFTSNSLKLLGIGFLGLGLGLIFGFSLNAGISIVSMVYLLVGILVLGTSVQLFMTAHSLRIKELYNLDVELVKRRA